MAAKQAPQNLAREAWARHLRNADSYSKEKKYEQAIFELEKALKLNPKDMYARSFLERLRTQWEKQQESERQQNMATEMGLEQRMELIPQLLSAAEKRLNARDYKGALAEIARIYKIDPSNYYAQAFSDRIDELMRDEESGKKAPTPIVVAPEPETPPAILGHTLFYRELLREYWFDGKLTEEEQTHLRSVREAYGISDADHERLSQQVKFDAYVEALRLAWIDGIITETERRTLEFMRNKYGISESENYRAEQLVQKVRKDRPDRERILIVDGDKDHAVRLSKRLKTQGFLTMISPRPTEALTVLQNTHPVAIIAAVAFSDSPIDGFELYRRVRSTQPFFRTPFFFTIDTDNTDVMYAAVRMGADHVLRKPADPEFIVAVLEGKRVRDELTEM